MHCSIAIEIQIETGTHIVDELGKPILKAAATAFQPIPAVYRKCRSVGESQVRVYELMLHFMRPHIHDLAVGSVRQKQIIEQLGAVPRGNHLRRFQLEDRAGDE